jgi:regulator of nucleoside diphosphate kinase
LRPRIYVTDADFETLSGLLTRGLAHAPGAALLGEELARAAAPARNGKPFVKLGSRVWFEDLDTGVRREVQVCTPRDASIDDNRISALTPIGAALIGVEAGATFEWTAADQRLRRIKVLEVLEPAR